MAFELTWMPAVLRQAGLKVAEVDGWVNRGRGHMPGARGVMCHHTAGPAQGNMPSLRVLVSGTPAIPGPLSQLGLGRDGTYYIVAAGRANHAGVGEWRGITAGNATFIGIEAENTGFEPWPAVQLDAYRRGVAALLRHMGAPAEMCVGHKEYARPLGRKPDPHTIDMNAFRAEVAALLADGVPPPLQIPPATADGRPTLRRSNPRNPPFVVKELQRLLGITGANVDGVFGPMTEARVRDFQRRHGLVPDGIVGPKTWEKLLA